jgi:hypothetical protein
MLNISNFARHLCGVYSGGLYSETRRCHLRSKPLQLCSWLSSTPWSIISNFEIFVRICPVSPLPTPLSHSFRMIFHRITMTLSQKRAAGTPSTPTLATASSSLPPLEQPTVVGISSPFYSDGDANDDKVVPASLLLLCSGHHQRTHIIYLR